MSLPDLIEIRPLERPVSAEITVPGSKSITNRALALAALGDGETVLRGALWSEDTQIMVECLRELGFMINLENDPRESCNRHITVYGLGGKIPPGGTPEQPLELFVGNAGTAARFLAALVCLGRGAYRLTGVPRMHERPQAALFQALRAIGYRVDSPNDKLPAVIHGTGPRPGRCQVDVGESSQFASALLLAAKQGGWQIAIPGEASEETSYIEMTVKLIEAFPKSGGVFTIEPDASSASYFWAAGWLMSLLDKAGTAPGATEISNWIRISNWPDSAWQQDQFFPRFLPLPTVLSRGKDLGDSIMTAIVLAPLAGRETRFSDLGRLRLQECERVAALRAELTKCGALAREKGDDLIIAPSPLHGAEIETYQDHRMAMCFSILGLHIPGIRIKNPACVKKTFPNFFQKLAAPPPAGLGAILFEAANGRAGRKLSVEELFAS